MQKRRRKNHIAYSYRGRKAFAESVHVYYLVHYVYAVHGGDRLAGKTELAVIVVLDYEAVWGLACPLKEGVRFANGSDRSGRKVV